MSAAPSPATASSAALDEAAAYLLQFIADSLAPLLSNDPAQAHLAHQAALRLIGAHQPSDEADLLLTAQMLGFGIAALRTLGAAHRPGQSADDAQRQLACATALSRAQDRLRRVRQTRGRSTPRTDHRTADHRTADHRTADHPTADHRNATPAPTAPDHATIGHATADTGGSRAAPAPDAGPGDHLTPEEWREREAWADTAAEAAQAALTAAPRLPPEQRKHALARAVKLGNAARDVRAGLPPPFDLPLPR